MQLHNGTTVVVSRREAAERGLAKRPITFEFKDGRLKKIRPFYDNVAMIGLTMDVQRWLASRS